MYYIADGSIIYSQHSSYRYTNKSIYLSIGYAGTRAPYDIGDDESPAMSHQR